MRPDPNPTRRSLLSLVPALVLVALVSSARAGDDGEPRDVSQYNLGEDGLALEGYDPVAYFPEGGGKPRKGLAELELLHEGVRYRFATPRNRDVFRARPARYEPAYGGWCAYAMAQGEKVEVDPTSFLVGEGGPLVFYKSFFNDTRKTWLKQPDELARKADAAWARILERPKG